MEKKRRSGSRMLEAMQVPPDLARKDCIVTLCGSKMCIRDSSNNDYDSALEYVTRALALNGEDLDARMLLAQIYEKNGDQEKAIAEFLAIVEENPDYEPAYGQLILSLIHI